MKNFLLVLFLTIFSISSHAQCNEKDISGCVIDAKKCLDLADNMPTIDQQNLIRAQCLESYKHVLTQKECLTIADQMSSEEAVGRARSICLL